LLGQVAALDEQVQQSQQEAEVLMQAVLQEAFGGSE